MGDRPADLASATEPRIVYAVDASRRPPAIAGGGSERWNEGLFLERQNAVRLIERSLGGKRVKPKRALIGLGRPKPPGLWRRQPKGLEDRSKGAIEYRIVPRQILDWPAAGQPAEPTGEESATA